jgi:DNA-binding transcriptional LysR family regulator
MSDISNASHDVNLRDLQVFVSVATTGSFRNAAKRMFTSQAAVSRSVARLERQLGGELFVRGPRGATPTPIGETVLVHTRKIGTQLAMMRADVRSGAVATLRLGAASTAAGSYLAPFLAQWIPHHPNVRVEVLEDGSAALRERLVDGDCDLAIVSTPVPDELDVAPIGEFAVRAYFTSGHPLDTGEDTISVQELSAHPLVINTPGYLANRLFLQECDASAVFPQIRYQSHVGQTLAALSEAGLGVAVIADSVDLRGFTLRNRLVLTRHNRPLAFTLAAAWLRASAPAWVRK